jgi:S-adenosylmethionine:tRNA ribosyltransferase-isomerase
MFSINDYNYSLPENLIAQQPAKKRDASRMLCLNKTTGSIQHASFQHLLSLLVPSDVLVVNNTKVIPARLFGKKETGGKIEVLILNYGDKASNKTPDSECIYTCLLKSSKRPKPGTLIYFDNNIKAKILDCNNDMYTVQFLNLTDIDHLLDRFGNVALPPYIKRTQDDNALNQNETNLNDNASYQTVYAKQKGAIAAPTAGLHFSEDILDQIKAKGVKIVELTLHVGYGTFLPVRATDIREHKMHSERFFISENAAHIINTSKANGSRIIAVGTTSVRTLEYALDKNNRVTHGNGNCDLFIYPGYRFNVVDAMITNFHLPQSTLLMLVSAFAGRNNILNAYNEAINNNYRFYSYGDAMFIA